MKTKEQSPAAETQTPQPVSERSQEDVQRAIAERERPYNGVPIRELTIDTPATMWPTSLDISEPSQRAAVFAAGNPADVSVPLAGEITFECVHWLIYAEEKESEETGEVKVCAVLVLFRADGKFLKTWSEYAPRRLKAALELYGRAPWNPPVRFVIRDRASKRPGRHYHDIRIAVDASKE